MRVKGMYCAISVPGERETWMKVCEVPTSRSNLQLERELARRFGRVKRVSCQMWSWREFGKANSTTRYVRLCLKKGLEEKDIPHLWTCFEHERYPIFVTGRPPLCLRCHAVSHLKHECKQPPCTGCDRPLHYSCASFGDGGEPLTSAAEENQKVPVKPGDVQVAPTEACGSEEQSVSNQETAPVVEETPAKEPHEVTGPDTETGSTSTVTRRGSNAEGDVTCSSGVAK
ncbi:hypothetical protein HPB52_000412 [Rhipicephalus sanguineus]|uniref:Uncharacterized protein n=2 Tax=Rhipicephalus sanguineus TaxID=34632 RepID=A0A9D4QG18_RHISA|nr:hypothetical protein HPB52_000412 [Rhipicephalus sanguineus]